jgi:hypothetical protein
MESVAVALYRQLETVMQSSASPAKLHKHRVCPWWLGYLLLNPIRRLLQDPSSTLAPYLRKG